MRRRPEPEPLAGDGGTGRDPAFIRAALPVYEALLSYFRPQVRGFEHVPARGPVLLVGNHSGAFWTPDAHLIYAAWWRRFGPERPFHGLGHDLIFSSPVGPIARRIGAILANMDNAGRALDRGAAVLVYPGGDHEVFRPWSRRNHIDFGGRRGFVRLALRHQVPVLPLVGHGSHHTTLVLARGDRIARALGLTRLRVTVFPWIFSVPFGVVPAFAPTVPLPARITLQIGAPMDWSRFGPEDADDDATVHRCYDEICRRMQRTLDRLVVERPPFLCGRVSGREGPAQQ